MIHSYSRRYRTPRQLIHTAHAYHIEHRLGVTFIWPYVPANKFSILFGKQIHDYEIKIEAEKDNKGCKDKIYCCNCSKYIVRQHLLRHLIGSSSVVYISFSCLVFAMCQLFFLHYFIIPIFVFIFPSYLTKSLSVETSTTLTGFVASYVPEGTGYAP
jgi:hypothetical protein